MSERTNGTDGTEEKADGRNAADASPAPENAEEAARAETAANAGAERNFAAAAETDGTEETAARDTEVTARYTEETTARDAELTDEEKGVLQRYALGDAEIRKLVIRDYLSGLQKRASAEAPPVPPGGTGAEVPAPQKRPRSLYEAGQIAETIIRERRF